MSKIIITIENGFTKLEMPADISTHHLKEAKRNLDKALQEHIEQSISPKLSCRKKTVRFCKRLYKTICKKIKAVFSAKPREQHIMVLKPILLESVNK